MKMVNILKLVVGIVLINILIFTVKSEEHITSIKSFKDLTGHNKNLQALCYRAVQLRNFVVLSNDDNYFNKIRSNFFNTLKKQKLKKDVKIFASGKKRIYDALVIINFYKKKLTSSKLYCDVTLIHRDTFRSTIIKSKLKLSICNFSIDEQDFNKKNSQFIVDYLIKNIVVDVNKLSEFSSPIEKRISWANDANELPLTSLINCDLIANFDMKLSKNFKLWHINSREKFFKLIDNARQNGYTKFKKGSYRYIDKKRIFIRAAFSKGNKQLLFYRLPLTSNFDDFDYFVGFDEGVLSKKGLLVFINNDVRKILIETMGYALSLLAVNEKYFEVLSGMDFTKQPIPNIMQYLEACIKLKKSKDIYSDLLTAYEEKIITYQNNDLLFPVLVQEFIFNISQFNRIIKNTDLNLPIYSFDDFLVNCKNCYSFDGEKISFIIKPNKVMILRFKDKGNKYKFILLKKINSYQAPFIDFSLTSANSVTATSFADKKSTVNIKMGHSWDIIINPLNDTETKITFDRDGP